jgi:catechol 2,3-dioxygenase-like lactoylglutathione lyase family enzyme
MKISKLLHAAILVNDLERAKNFYEGVVGLKEKQRHNFDFDGA